MLTPNDLIPEPLPVDIDQLDMLSGGDREGCRFLLDVYMRDTAKDIGRLQLAIQTGNSEEVRSIAHACRNASSTYGMIAIVPPLEQLEHEASLGELSNAFNHLAEMERAFERLQLFIIDYKEKRSLSRAA